MPENTLRLPTRPASTGSGKSRRRKRKGAPMAGLIVVSLLALTGVGAWAWWNGSVGPVPIREHCTATTEAGKFTELDPEQSGNAAIIAAVAIERGLPARAVSIGIATAIQESKLRNIDYGDRDSLGLFQQRPSQGWGTRKEITDPVYASNAFYDVLAKVDGYETMEITKVAQKVQRSAFPDAYADHEPEARIIASAMTGYSPGGFSCVLRSSPAVAQDAGAGDLTPRAAALKRAAARETGRKDATPVGNAGTAIGFTVPDTKNDRNAWALAHWAVGRAGALDVVRVDVGGRRWDRARSTDGWTTLAQPLAAGQVVVTVV